MFIAYSCCCQVTSAIVVAVVVSVVVAVVVAVVVVAGVVVAIVIDKTVSHFNCFSFVFCLWLLFTCHRNALALETHSFRPPPTTSSTL